MAHPDLINQDDIAEWSGYDQSQTARICDWLEENGISYKIGKSGRACTTIEAVNDSLRNQTGSGPAEFV